MRKMDLLWLAGLLEGEGCFYANGSTLRPSHGCGISLQMTDKDIVEKAASLLNVNLSGFQDARGNRKPAWRFQVCGDNAIYFMRLLLPFMGKRRTAKIKYLLKRAKLRATHQERGRRGSRSGISMQERGRRSVLSGMPNIKRGHLGGTAKASKWVRIGPKRKNGTFRSSAAYRGGTVGCRGWRSDLFGRPR